VASGSSDMGEPAADLSTPRCGHSRTRQLLTSFWSWWARRLFKLPPNLLQALSARFCSGLSAQAGKSVHFRRIDALRPLYKELCSQTRRYKRPNAVERKDFLFMTSPEGCRLFKPISARNADLADLEYLRQVDYAASHGPRIRLAADLADQEYLRHVDYEASRVMRILPARGSKFWLLSLPPEMGEPFNRSV
jgi:hypothetical protein